MKKWTPQQKVTREQASAAFLEYLAGLERQIAVVSGGGVAWGGITGTLADQTDLGTALAGKAATGHSHVTGDVTGLAEYIRDTVAAFVVAGTNMTVTHNDGADTLTLDAAGGGGGSPLMGWFV